MKKRSWFILMTVSMLIAHGTLAQTTAQQNQVKSPQTPVMGWASWNAFRVNISEGLIRQQARLMATNGMKKAGYSYFAIDDGFWGGRDASGNIKPHPVRFPNGMKPVADYIHSLGFKAGIYSDAGINTCASYWDKDTVGAGMGMFGREEKDLTQFLKTWGFDGIKVDWCGGEWLGLDEETQYTKIGSLVQKIKPGSYYNVCRWQFPGKWVTQVANSWRISGDIAATYESVLKIIDLNADLWKYAGPGHVNDMDMLQVGNGMSYEEDKTHFSMWCMMASPLIAGNDLTKMSAATLSILTNAEMIAINQDPLVYQARRIIKSGEEEVWAKPLISTMSGKVAVALLNRSKQEASISLPLEVIGLAPSKAYTVRNVWEHTSATLSDGAVLTYKVKPHGIVVLVITGTAKPFNVFQFDDNKKPV